MWSRSCVVMLVFLFPFIANVCAQDVEVFPLRYLSSWVRSTIEAQPSSEGASKKGIVSTIGADQLKALEIIEQEPYKEIEKKNLGFGQEDVVVYPLLLKTQPKAIIFYNRASYQANDQGLVKIDFFLRKEGTFKYALLGKFSNGSHVDYQVTLIYKIPENIAAELWRSERTELPFSFNYSLLAGYGQFFHQGESSSLTSNSWPILWGEWGLLFRRFSGVIVRGSIMASHLSLQDNKSNYIDFSHTDLGVGYDYRIKNVSAGFAFMRFYQNTIPSQRAADGNEQFKLVSTSLWKTSLRTYIFWNKMLLGYEFRWVFPQGISQINNTSITSGTNHQILMGYKLFPPFYFFVAANFWNFAQKTNDLMINEGSRSFFLGISQEIL